MSVYTISYNPYQNRTIILKNGRKMKENCALVKGLNNVRLQSWFDRNGEWKGLGEALELDNNDTKCEIEFIGREIDFLDLEEYFENDYKSLDKTKFILKSRALSNDENIISNISDLFEKMKNDNVFEKYQIKEIDEHIKRLKDDPFVISVIATMSSGKSTLLNALMHTELLPTGNDATTANIVEIFDNDSEEKKILAYDQNDKLIIEEDEVNSQSLKKLNGIEDIYRVKILGDIPGVKADKMQLVLRDTPGPNGTDDPKHKKVTKTIITNANKMSTVLYVMDGTKLRTESDKELLEDIAYEMKRGGKQACDRFLFVVNKVDLRLTNPEETMDKLIDDTKKYLEQFDIKNPRIFPISAWIALQELQLKEGANIDFVSMAHLTMNQQIFKQGGERFRFDKYASVSQSVRSQIEKEIKDLDDDNIDDKMLIYSGFKGLEYSIKEYMEKYAYPIKVSEVLNDIRDTIGEEEENAKFKRKLFSDEQELKKAKAELKVLREKKDERLESKEKFKNKINSYKLPGYIEDNARQSANNQFVKVLSRFRNKLKNEIEKDQAEEIIENLKSDIKVVEEKLSEELKNKINRVIVDEGNKILTEYKSYIEEIQSEIKLEYDFKMVKNLKNVSFDEVDEVADVVKRVETKDHYKTEFVPNPDRHWYTPWRPKKIEKPIYINTTRKEYVDGKAIRDELNGITANAEENIHSMVVEAERLIKLFKDYYLEKIEEFDSEIEKVINRCELASQDERDKAAILEEDRMLFEKFSSYIRQLDEITDIKEA